MINNMYKHASVQLFCLMHFITPLAVVPCIEKQVLFFVVIIDVAESAILAEMSPRHIYCISCRWCHQRGNTCWPLDKGSLQHAFSDILI